MGWTISNKRLQFLSKVIGTTIDRPPAAEKLRIDPWYVNLPSPDDGIYDDENDDDDDVGDDAGSRGDILCLKREGKGHLIFAKNECLQQRHKQRRLVDKDVVEEDWESSSAKGNINTRKGAVAAW
jgi:hypothetical protein